MRERFLTFAVNGKATLLHSHSRVHKQMVLRGGYMVGCWRMLDKTGEAPLEGWLHRGYMGQVDSEGYISMHGRWSERIVSEGKVIFPRPMEEAPYGHSAIQYVAVIRKPDPQAGEVPKAVVALKKGQSTTDEAFPIHCHAELGPTKVLSSLKSSRL